MARSFSWWNDYRSTANGVSNPVVDLLGGSGLDVSGATITRVIGHWDIVGTMDTANFEPRIECGVAVGPSLDQSQLFGDDGRDYLYSMSIGVTPLDPNTGDRVRTHWSEPGLYFDVAGQRVLSAGESLFMGWRWFNLDEDAGVAILHHARTLVLAPEE